jgi:large subunit ribosomal protein L18
MTMARTSRKIRITRTDRRKMRVRSKLRDTGKPRLSVFRSSRYIYAQIIDDSQGRTLAQANSLAALKSQKLERGSGVEAARFVGQEIANVAKEAGVVKVVFDRGSYRYHGQVKALAEAARKAGLEF